MTVSLIVFEYQNELGGTIIDIRSEIVRKCFVFMGRTPKQHIFGGFVRDNIAGIPE